MAYLVSLLGIVLVFFLPLTLSEDCSRDDSDPTCVCKTSRGIIDLTPLSRNASARWMKTCYYHQWFIMHTALCCAGLMVLATRMTRRIHTTPVVLLLMEAAKMPLWANSPVCAACCIWSSAFTDLWKRSPWWPWRGSSYCRWWGGTLWKGWWNVRNQLQQLKWFSPVSTSQNIRGWGEIIWLVHVHLR